jgi:hypothetical protein
MAKLTVKFLARCIISYFVIILAQPGRTSASRVPYSMSSPSRVMWPFGVKGSILTAVIGRDSTPASSK